MSSAFIGLQVKLTLHSQSTALKAKIVSIDSATNTLTVKKDDGSCSVLNRADIASLAAYTPPTQVTPKSNPAHLVPGQVSQASMLVPVPPAATDSASPKPKPKEALSLEASFVDPAIMSLSRNNDSSTPIPSSSPALIPQQHNRHYQSGHSLPQSRSRSSTPAQSPKPKAAVVAGKASKKNVNPISRGSSPALKFGREAATSTEDFDFGAGLAAFDKKRIWDEIRSSDNTDPASLLVSHNRITNEPVPLVRGPNGVGPANAAPTPQDLRGRTTQRDGQQKLRPNEMVCSPSPERQHAPSSNDASLAQQHPPGSTMPSLALNSTTHPVKPSYEDLESKILQLEAELALAHRRNVLLEELAGLGRASRSKASETPNAAQTSQTAAPPAQQLQAKSSVTQAAAMDPAILSTANGLNSLSLQQNSSKPSVSTASGAAAPSVPTSAPKDIASPAPSLPSPSASAARPTLKEPFFGHVIDTPVLTLLFPTAAIQHASLARMEAFYESDSSSKRYLSLSDARDERICRNYQGFNFPIEQGVKQWLAAMWTATAVSTNYATSMRWWNVQCSDEENLFLDLLIQVGAVSDQEAYRGVTSAADQGNEGITYVISTIASQANSTLPHELLHALYFLSPPYRNFVAARWSSLSAPIKKVIETDLSLRKYAPSVYEDEFQAYLAEGQATEKEFGNKAASECKLIAQQLRERVQQEWVQLGYSPQGKENLWEDAKWDTLDRYAAYQKSLKKTSKTTGAALPKKAKK